MQVNTAGSVETYTYSAEGHRQRKVTPAGTTVFLWDGENVLEERDAALVRQAHYTDFPGEWGGLVSQWRSGSASFYVFDFQGSSRILVGLNARPLTTYIYDSFGRQILGNASPPNPHRYGGRLGYYADAANALYIRARVLHPNSGRWASRDPLPMPYSFFRHPYLYVDNSPISKSDPSGLQKAIFCEGVCGTQIDDWILAEIGAQVKGWAQWVKQNPAAKIDDYIKWANGNQRYKDPNFFRFNQGFERQCGTQPNPRKPGCGFAVTLCGHCVRSSSLGNIMFGYVGHFAGFQFSALIKAVDRWKKNFGLQIDPFDREAYIFGWKLRRDYLKRPAGVQEFCKAFDILLARMPNALRVGVTGGGYQDLSTCMRCPHKTKETRHGGSEPPRLWP